MRIRRCSSEIRLIELFASTDARTQQFIRDINDGYFPSELQTRFPHGVPFEVTDKRDIYFTDERKRKAFQGEGHVLHDGRSVPSQQETLPPSSIPHGVRTESSDQRKSTVGRRHTDVVFSEPKVSLDQFLNRLPRAVIKNGRPIDIRRDIEQQLAVSESSILCPSNEVSNSFVRSLICLVRRANRSPRLDVKGIRLLNLV